MDLKAIKGLGPKKSQALEKLGVRTLEDLLYFLPFRYIDRRQILDLKTLRGSATGVILATVVGVQLQRKFSQREVLVLKLEAQGHIGEVVFFNGRFLRNQFKFQKDYFFYGEIKHSGHGFKMVHPEFAPGEDKDFLCIEPVYHLSAGISQKNLRSYVRQALALPLEENLPLVFVGNNQLCTREYALNNLHFPTDRTRYKEGKYRLIYEEFFLFILGNRLLSVENRHLEGYRIPRCTSRVEALMASLDFEPTADQLKVLDEILCDLEGPGAMRRLLQGDVGSGKTLVAMMGAYNAVLGGYQCGILAPTEILAQQLYQEFQRVLPPEITTALLTGASRDKEGIYTALKAGGIDILVGTHAMLQARVTFKKLGLLVIDEQHRFGVNQRQQLIDDHPKVNYLMMSATPIPRTLSMIFYADIEVSTIESLPRGRQQIETHLFLSHQEAALTARIKALLDQGQQGYVVFPLIEASSHFNEVDSLLEGFERIKSTYEGFPMAMIHGKMTTEEKSRVIAGFKSGEFSLLVSTTVIEVGIDHAGAGFMVVYNAERFGLSQLHQLRGRVGRGEIKSQCFLVTPRANENLKTLLTTNDGFKVAMADLQIRGPGEVLGLRQHGSEHFLIGDLMKHTPVMHQAMADVTYTLEHPEEFKDYLAAMAQKISIKKG